MITIEDIKKADNRIRKYIHFTPMLSSQLLNRMFNCEIYFKCENFQKAGAFKIRGATNAILSAPPNSLKNGVITHSSGNHAQALSLAAKSIGIPAYIVMPENSSKVKVNAVKTYGGNITFCEPNQKSREEVAKITQNSTGTFFIHPYDNIDIVTGQASVAYEILSENTSFDIIMAPVGGGGLLSGTALATKNINNKILVFGAEPQNANDAYLSFSSGKFVPSINPNTMADGLLTSLGEINFEIIKKNVDRILTCCEESIAKSMKLIYERLKIVVEPSAAVPLACVLDNNELFVNKKLCIIVSGGNIDLEKLKKIF